jgi:hypothetical protein
MEKGIPIPQTLKKFFWDSDFSRLNIPEHRNYILGKLMLYGNVESMIWIIRNFDRDIIGTYLSTKGKSVLDKKSYVLWSTISTMDELWQ